MIEDGVGERTTVKWASPTTSASKLDGCLWSFADYRLFNTSIIRDRYPIPRMDAFIDSSVEAQVFSTMNAHSGY